MSGNLFSWDLFNKIPIVGIIRNLPYDDVMQILPLYHSAGLTSLEITMNTPGAAEMIRYASEKYAGSMNVGAGTVCTLSDLEKAVNAGASFIVTPVVDEPVISACVEAGIPVFPGAFTPTEIYKAWSLGASIVKLFPAAFMGLAYIRDVQAPLNQVKLMPTGGVDINNCLEFLLAGVSGLGIGSKLFDSDLIRQKNWPGLEAHFSAFATKVGAFIDIKSR